MWPGVPASTRNASCAVATKLSVSGPGTRYRVMTSTGPSCRYASGIGTPCPTRPEMSPTGADAAPFPSRRGASRHPRGPRMRHHGGVSSKSAIRRHSAVFLVYLHQLPRWVPLIVLPALLIAGLAAPGVAGSVLLLALAVLLWFTFLASPARSGSHRLVRLAVPLVLVAVAVGKLLS
jgi:hypothetical protein